MRTRASSVLLNALLGGILALWICSTAHAAIYSFSSGTSWTSTSNWTNVNGGALGTPGPYDIAEFAGRPSSSGSMGFNFTNNASTYNGGTFTGSSGTGYDVEVGAIDVTSLETGNGFTIAPTTANGSGYLTLNGTTVGSQANAIIVDSGTAPVTIANTGAGASGDFLGVVLGTTGVNYVVAASSGNTSNGTDITINSNIDQANGNTSNITVLGGGNTTVTTGGELELAGTNSFTGGITVGDTSGTNSALLRFDAPSAVPSTGTIDVTAYSQVYIKNNGTYGQAGQMLELNGVGNPGNAGALRTGTNATWQGLVNVQTASEINVPSGSDLVLSGSVYGSSITLLGNGSSSNPDGTLELSGSNTFSGFTLGNASSPYQAGLVQIDTTSSMPASGTFTINKYSQLFLDTSGSFGGSGATLVLSSTGSETSTGALASATNATWLGSVNATGAIAPYISVPNGSDLQISGSVTGSSLLTFSSNGTGSVNGGTVEVSGSNSSTGGINVGAGNSSLVAALQADAAASLPTVGTITVYNNAELVLAGSGTYGAVGQSLVLNGEGLGGGNVSGAVRVTGTAAATWLGNVTLQRTTYITPTAGTSLTLSGTISEGGFNLQKQGGGALYITGNNPSETGTTTVGNGALFVNGSIGGSAPMNILSGGTLSGAGIIGGPVTSASGGTITTGNNFGAAGVLTLQSGLDLSAGGTYDWYLGDEKDNSTGAAGTDFDQIDLTGGSLTLGGTSALTLSFGISPNTDDSFWTTGHTWTIVNAGGVLTGSGTFGSITDATYNYGSFTDTADGNGDVTLTYTASAVPEPSTYAIIGMSAISLLALRRKRRRT